jgi:hypothetical protein
MSKEDLKMKIEQFIHYLNETMANSFCWTYHPKPLTQ